jgi:hypothetical protein
LRGSTNTSAATPSGCATEPARRRARPFYASAVERRRLTVAAPLLAIAVMLALPVLEAGGALDPLNDLLSLGAGTGQKPAKARTA